MPSWPGGDPFVTDAYVQLPPGTLPCLAVPLVSYSVMLESQHIKSCEVKSRSNDLQEFE